MTTPDDETTQHTIVPGGPGAEPRDPSEPPAPAMTSDPAAPADPIEPSDPATPDPETLPGAAPRTPTMPGGPLGQPAPPPPPLSPDPNRPADPGWREPPWIPPRRRDARPNLVALIVGFALIAFGVWFFVDRTLGIALPAIRWGSIWPIILIVIGAVVLLRSLDRSR
jgi:hypothetical protein